jgi:hypothetical protein
MIIGLSPRESGTTSVFDAVPRTSIEVKPPTSAVRLQRAAGPKTES